MGKLDYLAGFFDGEGSVTIVNHKGKYNQYTLPVNIANINTDLLNWLQQNFGGHIYPKGYRTGQKHDCFTIRWENSKTLEFMKSILSLSKVKRGKLLVGIEFQEKIRLNKPFRVVFSKEEQQRYLEKIQGISCMEFTESSYPSIPNFGKSKDQWIDDPVTDAEIEYIAGFFDGEGSITISKGISKHIQYSLMVEIANTNRNILEWIQNKVGGKIWGKPNENSEINTVYKLRFGYNYASEFLIKVLPYIKIKRQRALLGIEYQNKTKDNVGSHVGFTPEEKEKYKILIKNLPKNVLSKDIDYPSMSDEYQTVEKIENVK
jgi:intein-encoded DNA endonuclease-like protein